MNREAWGASVEAAQAGAQRPGVADIYRHYVREVLAEIVQATTGMAPGIERLCAGLDAYWDACLERRHARQRVRRAACDPATREMLLRISRPFGYLLHSELVHGGCDDAPVRAWSLFAAVREISQLEARNGRRAVAQRALLQQGLRLDAGGDSLPTA